MPHFSDIALAKVKPHCLLHKNSFVISFCHLFIFLSAWNLTFFRFFYLSLLLILSCLPFTPLNTFRPCFFEVLEFEPRAWCMQGKSALMELYLYTFSQTFLNASFLVIILPRSKASNKHLQVGPGFFFRLDLLPFKCSIKLYATHVNWSMLYYVLVMVWMCS